jgi:hypothetical protein
MLKGSAENQQTWRTPRALCRHAPGGVGVAVQRGKRPAEGHTCAIVTSTAQCWGDNSSGQLGNGTYLDADNKVAAIRTSRSPDPCRRPDSDPRQP